MGRKVKWDEEATDLDRNELRLHRFVQISLGLQGCGSRIQQKRVRSHLETSTLLRRLDGAALLARLRH